MAAPAAGAHRRRAAGAREQVHHAARAARGPAADPAAAAGQRVPDRDSARGLRRPGRRARRLPRERLLGNAREPQGRRRERRARRCRSRRCSHERSPRPARLVRPGRGGAPRALSPARAGRRGGTAANRVRAIVAAVRARGDAALRELTRRVRRRVRWPRSQVDRGGVRGRERGTDGRAARGDRPRDRDGDALSRGAGDRSAARRDRAGRRLRAHRPCRSRGRALRSRGHRAAALDRDHARRARAPRRLPAPHRCARRRGRDGTADPAVLVAARLCGVSQVFKIGGAQAIAAMAYGTESVPRVDKIFGPGNAWVTAAKQLVAADAEGAALDLPAGPSEVLVIADDDARRRVRRGRPARTGRTWRGCAGAAGDDLAAARDRVHRGGRAPACRPAAPRHRRARRSPAAA